jgi:hypothetical protein
MSMAKRPSYEDEIVVSDYAQGAAHVLHCASAVAEARN